MRTVQSRARHRAGHLLLGFTSKPHVADRRLCAESLESRRLLAEVVEAFSVMAAYTASTIICRGGITVGGAFVAGVIFFASPPAEALAVGDIRVAYGCHGPDGPAGWLTPMNRTCRRVTVLIDEAGNGGSTINVILNTMTGSVRECASTTTSKVNWLSNLFSLGGMECEPCGHSKPPPKEGFLSCILRLCGNSWHS